MRWVGAPCCSIRGSKSPGGHGGIGVVAQSRPPAGRQGVSVGNVSRETPREHAHASGAPDGHRTLLGAFVGCRAQFRPHRPDVALWANMALHVTHSLCIDPPLTEPAMPLDATPPRSFDDDEHRRRWIEAATAALLASPAFRQAVERALNDAARRYFDGEALP